MAKQWPVHDKTVQNSTSSLALSRLPRKTSALAENRFLADVSATMAAFSPRGAAAELDNWGGWWRNRYRENPDKAHRVLAEIRSMVREGRVTANPGAAAMDLWSRWP